MVQQFPSEARRRELEEAAGGAAQTKGATERWGGRGALLRPAQRWDRRDALRGCTAPNYCTGLPVGTLRPALTAQCQDVNTALLTGHTVCAGRCLMCSLYVYMEALLWRQS